MNQRAPGRPGRAIAWGTALAIAALAAGGCGAKTGLLVPDFERPSDVFEDASDAFVRFDACVAGRFTMVRRSAEMLFVIDRSGSMSEQLELDMRATRWEAMRLALFNTLPSFQRDLDMGVFFFPRVASDGVIGNQQYCMLSPGTGVDVIPARNNATEVINAVYHSYPRGATPTAAALERAHQFMLSRDARGRARYMVLATDGAPNCNEMLDGTTCTCTSGPGECGSGTVGAQFCLDDDRTIRVIEQAAHDGIATYVIGLDGDLDAQFVDVLDRMAVAGGRARTTTPRYISIRRADALTEAFQTIQQTVVRCSFVTPSRPDDPDAITISVGSTRVPRDTTHTEGWDWSDRDYGEVALYGNACQQALAANGVITAEVACRMH